MSCDDDPCYENLYCGHQHLIHKKFQVAVEEEIREIKFREGQATSRPCSIHATYPLEALDLSYSHCVLSRLGDLEVACRLSIDFLEAKLESMPAI
ncbi:hypothetical protein TNCV_1894681 [Trichonephila clavipes]|nr:hypothetical protein TNCV_1894681 [Trichonephila clavipes]